MATEYGILVKAHADTAGLKKEIQDAKNDIQKDTKINITVQTDERALEKLHKNTNLISDDFKKIKQEIRTAFNFKYVDSRGTEHLYKKVDKVVETFKNASGEVQKLESILVHFGGRTEVLSSQVMNSTKVFEGYNKTLSNTKARLQEIEKYSYIYKNDKGEKVTETFSVNNNGEEIKRITYLYEELGVTKKRITEQVRDENGVWGQEKEVLKEVTANTIALEEARNKLQLENMTENEKLYNQQMKEAEKNYNDNLKAEKEVIDANEKLYNQQMREAEAIVKKNEELKKSTILYEEQIKTKTKDGNLTINKATNKAGQTEQTEVLEYEDKYGRLIQETNKYLIERDGTIKRIGDSHVKIVNDQIAKEKELNKEIKDTVTTNNSYKKVIGLTTHSIKEETKQTTSFGNETKKVKTITDEYIDSQGRLVTTITKVDDAGKTTTETLIKMGESAKHIGQSFTDVIVKVTKFYLASLPVRAVQTAITDATQSVKDFDSALTEFRKVSDLSGEALDNYALKLEELGELTARTRTEMVQMATEFKRSGFSDEESAKLAQVASTYQNIADEELSAADASAVLISQIKAFQKQGIKAEHVIDAINETANKNAVSSGDIGRGLTQAGAALSTYGNTFEETIGLKLGQLKPT